MRNFILYFILLLLCFVKHNSKIAELPKKLKIGYAFDDRCDSDKIYEAVQNGLNVVIWFSLDMGANSDGTKPEFKRGPPYDKVAETIKKFKDNHYSVVNLISVGGWNYPHPDTRFTAEQYYNEWVEFNKRITNEALDFYGFDGLDWDLEGNDDVNSSINYFTFEELDLMGELSLRLKQGGYYVTMAPPESYLDPSTEEFKLDLLHNYPEWETIDPSFTFHGRNAYSYLLAKYSVETFDFISVQLYEGYSHALYKYERQKIPFGEILYELVDNYTKGYYVDFSQEEGSGMNRTLITIPSERIVIGLANAWARGKFAFIEGNDIINGYTTLVQKNQDVRGFMYWNIVYEGNKTAKGEEFYLTKVLNKIFPEPEPSWSFRYSVPIFLELLILLFYL